MPAGTYLVIPTGWWFTDTVTDSLFLILQRIKLFDFIECLRLSKSTGVKCLFTVGSTHSKHGGKLRVDK